MRLGELLVRQRLITSDQLHGALEAQRAYGGRLGTNLVHLNYLEVDLLSRALSEQQRIPAVLRQHVAAIDKRVLSVFSVKLLTSLKIMPVSFTATRPPRIIVACASPSKISLDELSFAAGCRLDVGIAPEILIDECLEKYFGVPRAKSPWVDVKFGHASSMQRVAAGSSHEAPPPASRASAPAAPGSKGTPVASKTPSRAGLSPPPPPPAAVRYLEPPPPPLPPSPPAPVLEPPPPPPPPPVLLEPPPRPAPLPDLTRVLELPEPAVMQTVEEVPVFEKEELPPEEGWDLADVVPQDRPLSAPPDALRPVIDLAEATRLLEMATSKEHIGRVLEDWLRSTFGCGLVLVVKGDMAVGWKGFFADAEDLVEAVAIPLGKPSLLTIAHGARTLFCGKPSEDGAKLNHLLWKVLRCSEPAEVLVCPVVLGERVVNILYSHVEQGASFSPATIEEARALADGAAAAYARLIRRERGKR